MSPTAPDAFDGPYVIVVGVDTSTTGLRAGAYAAGLARRQRCRLVVVHVAANPPLAYLAPEVTVGAADAARDLTEDIRQQVLTHAERLGVNVEFRVGAGDPFTVISQVAAQVHADLVVVGASSRLGHRVAGSVAVRLVKTGRWPVTVVP